jgi:hypothetical protein
MIAGSTLTWRASSQTSQLAGQQPRLKPADVMIEELKQNGAEFPEIDLFLPQLISSNSRLMTQDALKQGAFLNLNTGTALRLASGDTQNMTLRLPDPAGFGVPMELELTQVNLFADGFNVLTSSSGEQPVDYQPGIHYRGSVKGSPGSLAAISVFGDEIAGVYSTPAQGNFVLGKLGGNNLANTHVIYAQGDLSLEAPPVCATVDDNTIVPMSDLQTAITAQPGGCVKIYVEADYDIFQNKGSVTNTVNYLTAVFNQSATLYANDGIPVSLSQIFVWDTTSPYTSSSSSTLLSQFQNYRNSFNGDLGHLVALRGGGGIAAGFNAFCNSNIDNRQCFSGIQATYSNVPTYSWTVEVFTHEMGHLMGSRHTHACVWNGNGTAIDGCYTTEGGCARPAIPSNGGTIMSYCHLTSAGINFTLGFGPQPGSLIRSRVTAASCIAGCGTSCTYSISPTSRSVSSSATTGSVAVTASSGCSWTAVSNNSFITVTSGGGGSGNGTVNYSVSANTSTSSRTGTVTIAGQTFTITQEGTTGGGGELITNGGFESGTASWSFSGSAGRSTGAYPRSGAAYSIVVNANSTSGAEYQQITLPSGSARNLRFYLNVTSSETTTSTRYDNLYIEVRSTSGALLGTLANYSNLNKATAGAYTLRGPFSLSAYAGQTVRIQFRATNDSSLASSFRIDDVSVQ